MQRIAPLSLLILLVTTACGAVLGPSDAELTLSAQNRDLGTQVALLRETATVEVDRMQITLEHAQTEVRNVEVQNLRLLATLEARGTSSDFLGLTEPEAATLPPGIDPAALLPEGADLNGGAPPVSTATPTATPPPAPTSASGAQLVNATLASGVQNDDCALDTRDTFDVNTAEIYVVATAVNFPANTTVTARWFNEGTEVGTFPFTYDFEIPQACIWFFIDQSDVTFTPGNWSVQLDLDGERGFGPLTFTIVGDGTEDAMAEGS